MFSERLAPIYRALRGSGLALCIIVGFCAIWMTLDAVLKHFDPGLGIYNSILSTEASIGMSLMLMWMQKQDDGQRKQLEYMQLLMEAQRDTLKELIAYEKDRMANRPSLPPGGDAAPAADVA